MMGTIPHGIRAKMVFTGLAAMALLSCAETGRAQEAVVDNESGVGARAMGMGGTGIAAVNDLSAVVYNPAALVTLTSIEGYLGVNFLNRDINTTLKSSVESDGTISSLTDYSGIGSFGVAYPVPTERGSLVLALAYNKVKDFDGRLRVDGYDDVFAGFKKGDSIEEGGLGTLSFAGAVDVAPHLSIGAAFDIWMGSYKLDNRMVRYGDTDDPEFIADYPIFSWLDIKGRDDDITAWSFKPSMLYHRDRFRFGAYLQFPMQFHVKEYNYTELYSLYCRDVGDVFNLYEVIDPTSEFNDDAYTDRMSYTIKAPMQFGVGFAWTPVGKSMVSFDVIYQNWKQAKLDYPSDYIQEPNYFRDKYRSSLSWRVGCEQPLPLLGLVGRVGYLRQPLLFKGPRDIESNLPEITVEKERDFITVGLGKQFEGILSVDAALSYGVWKEQEGPMTNKENRTRFYISMTYLAPKLFQ